MTASWALGCVSVAGAHPREGSSVCLRACVCLKLSVWHMWSAAVASTGYQ